MTQTGTRDHASGHMQGKLRLPGTTPYLRSTRNRQAICKVLPQRKGDPWWYVRTLKGQHRFCSGRAYRYSGGTPASATSRCTWDNWHLANRYEARLEELSDCRQAILVGIYAVPDMKRSEAREGCCWRTVPGRKTGSRKHGKLATGWTGLYQSLTAGRIGPRPWTRRFAGRRLDSYMRQVGTGSYAGKRYEA